MKQVIVYTQTPCKYCDILKAWMNSEGIEFEARNITENPTYKEEALDKGAMGMPFTVIGEKTFSGFNGDVQEGILASLAE